MPAGANRSGVPLFLAVLLLATVLLSRPLEAGEVRLAWDPSPDADVSGYRIYQSDTAGSYYFGGDSPNLAAILPAGTVNCTIAVEGGTKFFVGTAVDTDGNESGPSNEVTVTLPDSPESITVPAEPSGATRGLVNVVYEYITGGSVSSRNHPVQYGFSWGDGTLSGWLPQGDLQAGKVWPVPGTYAVASEARCVDDIAVETGLAGSLQVLVESSPVFPETVSTPQAPAGASQAVTGATSTYTAAESTSSEGHAVQHRIFWGDGSATDWLPVGVTAASKAWMAPGLYSVRTASRCAVHSSLLSSLSEGLAVQVGASENPTEAIAAPSSPEGPQTASAGKVYQFSVGDAASSDGHGLEYRLDWGDGSITGWLAAVAPSAGKAWHLGGTYHLRSQARCAVHPDVRSGWSGSLAVTVKAEQDEIGVYRDGSWLWDRDNNGKLEEGFDYRQAAPFAEREAQPVVADLDGDGFNETGTFHKGEWRIDMNGDGQWEDGVDLSFGKPGLSALEPVAGDVDGDGIDEIGAYQSGFWYFDSDGDGRWVKGTDLLLGKFGGRPGMVPVTGDVDGDGIDEIGVYDDGKWYFDLNGDGTWDRKADLSLRAFGGRPGMVPVTGDVDGDGTDEVGVYQNGNWYFDMNRNGTWDKGEDSAFGKFGGDPGDRPVVGNFR